MIDKTELNKIIDRIRERFQPEKIILFGSQASGTATKDSDIDLLIIADTDIPKEKRYRSVCQELEDFPYAFDAFLKTPSEYSRWRNIVNNIIYYADKYGQVVYER